MKIKFKDGYIAIYSETLTRIFGVLGGVGNKAKAAAIFPIIIFKDSSYELPHIVNHEKIHFRQEIELLFIGVWIIRYMELFYARFFLKKNGMDAYIYGAVEQEAYLNQLDNDYLKNRKSYAIFRYIKDKSNFRLDTNNTGMIIIND